MDRKDQERSKTTRKTNKWSGFSVMGSIKLHMEPIINTVKDKWKWKITWQELFSSPVVFIQIFLLWHLIFLQDLNFCRSQLVKKLDIINIFLKHNNLAVCLPLVKTMSWINIQSNLDNRTSSVIEKWF
jgi:hypothetical protein